MKALRMTITIMLLVFMCTAGVWAAGKEILFSYNASGIEEELVQKVVADFMAAHPGVTVKLQNIVGNSGGAWFDQLLVRIAAGVDIPDVYLMEYNKALGLIGQNRIMAIDALIKRDRVNIADLVPAGIEGISYEGKIYGLPSRVDGSLFYANMDLLSQAGFNLPSNKWTLNDMMTIAKRVSRDTDGDGNPNIWGIDYSNGRYTFPAWQTIFGGKILDEKGEVVLDKAPSVSALQYAQDMVFNYRVAPNPTAMPSNVGFAQGNTGFFYHYAFQIREMRRLAQFSWDILPQPVGPAGEGNILLGNMFMIDAKTKEPDLAWELVQYLYSPQVQTRFALEAGSIFPRKSFFAQNVYAKSGLAPNNWAAVSQAYMVAGAYPALPNLDKVRTAINNAIIGAFQKQQQPQEALSTAAAQVRAALQELKK